MRPTISLACILKNELNNIPQMLSSIEGCFDEIHLTDTGSTDGSCGLIENYIESGKNPSKSKLFLYDFKWVNDFSKARQSSFASVATDYVMWMDLDDILSDKKAFIDWRDTVLGIADFWMATYHYGSDAAGKPNCSFARERVVKRSLNFQWHYFVHEGMRPESNGKPVNCQYATTWSIVHKRTEKDLKADRSRNLKLFEINKNNLDPRMRYYYGKELFENGHHLEAFTELMGAVTEENLEIHDRITGLQYACMAAMHLNQFEKAIQLAHQGLQLSPQRAEFYVVIGDSYLKQQKIVDAIPFYEAAHNCTYHGDGPIQGALFSQADMYRQYPLNQLARIYVNLEKLELADKRLAKARTFGANHETIGITKEFENLKKGIGYVKSGTKVKTEDIVFTCHPNGPYEWDQDAYRERGIGGSETAVVEMAAWLQELTRRNVIVFNNRTKTKNFERVSYRPASELPAYFIANEPKINIAWRHNIKFTDAPTYCWLHDLAIPGLEKPNYTKIMALSQFHKNYLKNVFNVPEEKIWVTSNGIDPTRFTGFELGNAKVPNRVIWSSSPDRGLDRAMLVMDEVVKEIPDATLHVFYGFDNMRLCGKHDEVVRLEKMMAERHYVTNCGNVPQSQLTKEIQRSCVWLYPTNFLETYCITAIEMLAGKCYPVARYWGGLKDTLSHAEELGFATLLDCDCETQTEINAYARVTINALKEKSYEKIKFDAQEVGWENVARSWIKEMGL